MQGQHWVCEPSVKCVVCTIKHTCGKQIFIYLMSINALIYIGELNQKNLHNKLKSETGWTHLLHCPSLTHFVVVNLLPRNMPFFAGVLHTGFYFSFSNLKRSSTSSRSSEGFPVARNLRGGGATPGDRVRTKRRGCYYLPFPFTSNGHIPSEGTWQVLQPRALPVKIWSSYLKPVVSNLLRYEW